MDLLLPEHRDKAAALRFLQKALRRHGLPETIPMDGRDAQAAAITSDHEAPGTAIISRQVQDRNTLVEQDQRAVTRVTRPMLGVKSCAAAHDTLGGIALRPMLKQRPRRMEAGDAGLTAAEQFYALAASSLHRPGPLPLYDLPSKICDRASGGACRVCRRVIAHNTPQLWALGRDEGYCVGSGQEPRLLDDLVAIASGDPRNNH